MRACVGGASHPSPLVFQSPPPTFSTLLLRERLTETDRDRMTATDRRIDTYTHTHSRTHIHTHAQNARTHKRTPGTHTHCTGCFGGWRSGPILWRFREQPSCEPGGKRETERDAQRERETKKQRDRERFGEQLPREPGGKRERDCKRRTHGQT